MSKDSKIDPESGVPSGKEFYQHLEVDLDYLEYCREFDLRIAERYQAKAAEIREQVSPYVDLDVAHILDLGCGRGAYGRLLVGERGRVTGLDLNLTELNLAKEQARLRQQYVIGNGYTLPFLSDTFDLVLCRHTLEHLTRPVEFLHEIYRVLKPGSYAYVSTPNLLSMACILTTLDGRKLLRRKLSGSDEGVYQIYSLNRLRKEALRAGFTRTRCLPLPGMGQYIPFSIFQHLRPSHKMLLAKME